MADAVAVGTVLDTTGLELLDHLLDVHGDGAELGVRHQATGAEDAAETTDLAHEVRGRDDGVEVDVALLDILDEVVGTDDVGTCRLGLLGLGALCEDGDADGLAGAVGQGDGATDVLVSLTGVDAQADGSLDGLVELGGGELLHELHGLLRAVDLCLVELGSGVGVVLSVLRHFLPPVWLAGGVALPRSWWIPTVI